MGKQLTLSDSRLLFAALGANGLFSVTSGLVMALGSRPLAAWLGLGSHYWLLGTGVVLLGFGASLLVHYYRRRVSRGEALAISLMDLGWVLGSAALIVFTPQLFSGAGLIAVAIVAVIVLTFFELQVVALWRVSKHS